MRSAFSAVILGIFSTLIALRRCAESAGHRHLSQAAVSSLATTHAYVAACVLAKNEHRHIREFIQYHHWIGIDKIYLWDHQSNPPLADLIVDYVQSSLVEVIYFSDSWRADERLHKDLYKSLPSRRFLSPQGWAYDNCYRMFAYRHTFMLLIDPDEFIVIRDPPPPARPHLPSFLAPFEAQGGLMVHWQLFGPSGHLQRPNGSTLESYTQCMSREAMQSWSPFNENLLGFAKTITATRCYKEGCNPHICVLQRGCRYVNEQNMTLAASVLRAVHWDRIVVFHYITRSLEDYTAKLARGTGHSQFFSLNQQLGRTNRGWGYFHSINATANAVCLEGRQLWERCCSPAAAGAT